MPMSSLTTPCAATHDAAADWPRDPVAAVTHADPFPYYRALRDRGGICRDPVLQAWVAAGDAAVAEALSHPALRVRPADQPVPPVLVGTPAAEVFARLVRMTDGGAHRRDRAAVVATLAGFDDAAIGRAAHEAVAAVGPVASSRVAGTAAITAAWSEALFRLPLFAVARLLGLDASDARTAADDTRRWVAALAPGADEGAVRAGLLAMPRLLSLLRTVGRTVAGAADDGPGWSSEASREANLLGLLMQTCDATAGLLGGTLLALANAPETRCPAVGRTAWARARVDALLGSAPPIHNTRRWAHECCTLGGQPIARGDLVLVLLLAQPFGSGPHTCPGRGLAVALAAALTDALLDSGYDPLLVDPRACVAPSVNARIPLLTPRVTGSAP